MKQKIILAFSGGSDSTFLLDVIYRYTNRICHAVFFKTPFVSPRTDENVCRFLEKREINYTILPIDTLQDPDIVVNQPDRCFHCKKLMFETLFQHFDYPVESLRFMEGTNFSEALSERRPGLAAIGELGVESPLCLAGITEEDIAALREELNLTSAVDDVGCLATRVPYETPITEEVLKRIDDAEDFLRQRGFRDVRVRFFDETVKIEVNKDDLARLMRQPLRGIYLDHLKDLGFSRALLDMEGYQKGALDKLGTLM